jgi:lipopolysaccharide/colanic/teichoic acid biosynthesis glycosyltransferase
MSRGLPRVIECLVAWMAVLALAPLLVAIAVAVRLSSPGPVLYRQQRIGRDGVPFTVLKFRTMHVGADATGQLTVGQDPKVTRVGVWLRRHKFDELPQLLNVLHGEMGLVGPRPEVPEYVRGDLADQVFVLRARPGLSDPASLAFRDEAALLSGSDDPAEHYRSVVLPAKLRLSADYLRRRTAVSDVGVLVRTALCVIAPQR